MMNVDKSRRSGAAANLAAVFIAVADLMEYVGWDRGAASGFTFGGTF